MVRSRYDRGLFIRTPTKTSARLDSVTNDAAAFGTFVVEDWDGKPGGRRIAGIRHSAVCTMELTLHGTCIHVDRLAECANKTVTTAFI